MEHVDGCIGRYGLECTCRLVHVSEAVEEKMKTLGMPLQKSWGPGPSKPSLQDMVKEFHVKFEQPVGTRAAMIDRDRRDLRHRLVEEEAKEFENACADRDMVEMVDAAVDLIYVALGALVELGVDVEPVFAEVHRSNMAKLWPNEVVWYDDHGKVKKPPGWTPPDIERCRRAQGWEGKRKP